MKKLGGVALSIAALFLSGCGAVGPAATPTVTVTVTSTPAPVPTVTVTVDPEVAVAPSDDRLAALREVSQTVTRVEEAEPGRWVVHTSIEDPHGDDGTSAEAEKAIAICERAVELGASKVSVMESDGTTFVLYGHPSYGNVCAVP